MDDGLIVVPFQLGHNEDRNYTGGFGAVASGSFVDRAKLNGPLRLLDGASRSARMHGRWDHHYHSLQFFGTGFAPDELNTAEVVQGDRPMPRWWGFPCASCRLL